VLYLAPVLLWKRHYYGYWLPNTWYVKGSTGFANLEQGWIYFLFNAERYMAAVILLVGAMLYGVYKNKSPALKVSAPLVLIATVWMMYIIMQGGDNMVGGRFILPVLPLGFCLIIKVISQVQMKPTWAMMSATILGIVLIYGYLANPGLLAQAESWRNAFPIRKNAGIYLRNHFPENVVVALNQAGIIPYYSQLPIIDMLGLNNVHIAHNGKRNYNLWYAHQAGDGDYVLSQKPDIIIFSGDTLSSEPGNFISDQEIWSSDQFWKEYTLLEWPGIGYVYARKKDR
jgi:hypothetical protein